jgi:hypothetical protein
VKATLNDTLGKLIESQRMKVRRDDGSVQWQTLPSLFDQLQRYVLRKGAPSSGGGVGRLPISATVIDLLLEISAGASKGIVRLGMSPRESAPANLRGICGELAGRDPSDVQVKIWDENLRGWSSRARTALGLDPERPRWARGVACPSCGELHAIGSDGVGETRVPALGIAWGGPDGDDTYASDLDWKVRAVQCGACGCCLVAGA